MKIDKKKLKRHGTEPAVYTIKMDLKKLEELGLWQVPEREPDPVKVTKKLLDLLEGQPLTKRGTVRVDYSKLGLHEKTGARMSPGFIKRSLKPAAACFVLVACLLVFFTGRGTDAGSQKPEAMLAETIDATYSSSIPSIQPLQAVPVMASALSGDAANITGYAEPAPVSEASDTAALESPVTGNAVQDEVDRLAAEEETQRQAEADRLAAEEEARKQAAEAEVQTEITPTQMMGSGLSLTQEELNMLAAIIYCEAGNQPYEGKVAVGAVVVNRILNSRFPESVERVIRSPGQFTPVRAGKFDRIYGSGSWSESCYAAAVDAANGQKGGAGDALFFKNPNSSGSHAGTIIGDHVFW